MNETAPPIEDSLAYKVVKDNQLIREAQTDLTKTEQKLVNYMISLVKPDDEDFKAYRVRTADFAAIAGLDVSHISRGFRELIDNIDKKSFWFENDEVAAKIHWFISPKHYKNKGIIELRLDPDIKKYLIGLKKNFTEYELFNIMALNTKYAITVYEFLKSYQYAQKTDIEIDTFKKHIGAYTSTYKNFGIFKKKVLDPTIDDINDNTDLDINYYCLDSHKKVMESLKGRKVSYLRFFIKAKGISDTFEVYTKMKDRIKEVKTSDQVPHQISFDTDNETTALFDDTTNQQIN